MTKVRVAWMVLATLAVAFAVWQAFEPVGSVSLSCSKGGVLYEAGTRPGATCDDSMYSALGIWPLVLLGAILGVPAAIAAIVMRCAVSWLAVASLAGISAYGLGHWPTFWILLLLGGTPMTVVALVIAVSHLAVRARRDSQRANRNEMGTRELSRTLRRTASATPRRPDATS